MIHRMQALRRRLVPPAANKGLLARDLEFFAAATPSTREAVMQAWTIKSTVFFAVALLGLATASAQTYPGRQIRIIVPYPSGTGTDTVARAIAQKLTETWGQPVVVDNRAGAAGIVGSEAAAQAAPDGYTLLMADVGPLTMNPALYPKLPYDPVKDFAPVVEAAFLPLVLAVHPSVPAHSVKELIALAKRQPGQLNYGSPGSGSAVHLASELFKSATGTEIVHVPYKGAPPAMADLMAGQISVLFTSLLSAQPHAKTGRIRVLGIATVQRSRAMPDVPTLTESGLASVVAGVWFGILTRAGTPEPVITRLNTEINRILRLPDIVQRLADQGGEVIGGTPQQFADHIKRDTAKWAEVVKATGLRLN